MNDNDKTIEAYENNVDKYVSRTFTDVSDQVAAWLQAAVADLGAEAKIIEFGSGPGRDAAYLAGQGYRVQCTDATQGFIDLLQEKGFDARKLNLLTDEIPEGYDLALANAVLLHFSIDEMRTVLRKVYDALEPGGRFGFTLKEGEGDKWSDAKLDAPRYFHYWRAGEIEKELHDAGFNEISIDGGPSPKGDVWLFIIAHK